MYARYGGALKLDLRAASPSDEFRYTWFDLAASKEATSGTIKGGAVRSFHAPDEYPAELEYRDWLLYVRKQ